MTINYGSSLIVKQDLALYLDAANTKSYPGSGTSWYDLSGRNNDFTINSSAFNSSNKYMDFNGSYGCAKKTGSDLIFVGDYITAIVWTRVKNSTAEWRTLFRGLSSGGDHQVIVQSGGWLLGMYDNINGTGFNSSGFSQQSLPAYGTSKWDMLVWRWSANSPYYNFSYNDTPGTIRGSNASANAKFKCGICSIGAYNNGEQNNPLTASQYWGDISSVMIYERYLSNEEIIQNYNSGKSRYSL